MVQESGRLSEQLSYGDRKRKTFLIFSTCLLTVSFFAALLVNDMFNNLRIVVCSFLLPAIQTGLAAALLDKIRIYKMAFLIVMLSFLLSMATIVFAIDLKTPLEEIAIICCVNIVWSGLFQMGLALVQPFMLPQMFGTIATNFISQSQYPVWTVAIPISLGILMIWLRSCLADSGAGSDRDCGGDAALTTEMHAGGN